MTTVWVDTNVLLRFITGDPSETARRARRLLRRAADGELTLRVPSVVIAEIIWLLGSYYSSDRATIAEAIRGLVLADGVLAENKDLVLDALRLMQDANVAYVDAYIAASARANGEAVAAFDNDFKRLGVELFS